MSIICMSNVQVAADREERRSRELAEMEEYALNRMETKDREHRERIAKASEAIKREKVKTDTIFINKYALHKLKLPAYAHYRI